MIAPWLHSELWIALSGRHVHCGAYPGRCPGLLWFSLSGMHSGLLTRPLELNTPDCAPPVLLPKSLINPIDQIFDALRVLAAADERGVGRVHDDQILNADGGDEVVGFADEDVAGGIQGKDLRRGGD